MSRAFIEREAAPHVHTAPCAGCGHASESPLCDDCTAACDRAAEHAPACQCWDCATYTRAIAAGEVSL